jgi:protein-S-isoprenylcysteine O-methyltransferase Ste14
MLLLHQINPDLIRNALLLIAAAGAIILILSGRYNSRHIAGAFLGFVWQFQTRLMLACFSVRNGWLSFPSGSVRFYDVPIDLMMGQSLFLGFVLFSLCKNKPWMFIISSAALDLFINSSALVNINAGSPALWTWILILITAGSYFLSSSTVFDRHIYARSTQQSVCWVSILAWFFPSMIFQNDGHSWLRVLERSWPMNAIYLFPLTIPGIIIVFALREFAVTGDGTAFPYDPPKRLVSTGIYAYISNPMQIGICLFMAWWGVVLESPPVTVSAVIAFLLFIVFKNICNGSCWISKIDPDWARYQAEVPKWLPKLKAWK